MHLESPPMYFVHTQQKIECSLLYVHVQYHYFRQYCLVQTTRAPTVAVRLSKPWDSLDPRRHGNTTTYTSVSCLGRHRSQGRLTLLQTCITLGSTEFCSASGLTFVALSHAKFLDSSMIIHKFDHARVWKLGGKNLGYRQGDI